MTGGGGGSGGSGATGGADAGPTQAIYLANVADCVDLTDPDPDVCEAKNGGAMSVDNVNDALATSDAAPGPPSAAFLRFNLDGAFAGKTVTKVEVEAKALTGTSAASDSSGQVWSVSTFTRPDLFTAVPTKGTLLAGSVGAVASGATVKWTLPTTSVTAGNPACFGIYPVSTNGVDYQNAKGTSPPRLIVSYQ